MCQGIFPTVETQAYRRARNDQTVFAHWLGHLIVNLEGLPLRHWILGTSVALLVENTERCSEPVNREL